MRVLFTGGAAALVLGVLSGHLMHPDLGARTDRPMGPQMFADWPGEGTTGPFDSGTTFAAYHGQAPDYLYGTDWKRTMAWPSEPGATAAVTRARYDEPADPPNADDPGLSRDDDTTVAERDPDNPAREPAYERPAPEPATDQADEPTGH